MNLVDSSGWIEYFRDGPNAQQFSAPLLAADHLIVPSVVVYEVTKVMLREANRAAALAAIAQLRRGKQIPLDGQLAANAARFSLEHKLAMADSIILTTASAFAATIWTQDEDFEGLAGVRYFAKERPLHNSPHWARIMGGSLDEGEHRMRGQRSGQIGLGEDLLFGRVDDEDFLMRVDRAVDWAPIDALFDGLYGDTGKPSHPPLTVFKMLLLSQWFDLSDPGCEAAVRDRISFMRFVGLGLADGVPDETVLVRFRRRLLDAGMAERVFGEVTRQLEANNLLIKRGSLVDASLVEASRRPPGQDQAPGEPDARWAQKGKRSVYGYKAHVAVDEGSDLIRQAILTPAHVHDRCQAEALIQGDEGRWVADKGYADGKLSEHLREQGITDGILRKGYRNRALSAADKAHNARYIPIRAPVERIFADLKQHRGLRRMRYVGQAKGQLQLTLLAIAHNLRTMLRCTPPPRLVL